LPLAISGLQGVTIIQIEIRLDIESNIVSHSTEHKPGHICPELGSGPNELQANAM
jgi:hypothetical protein